MDAAGKDGVIRTVFSTLSPHGVREYCFKAPTSEELAHDYLWRFWSAQPAKGNISIFNRSYYEDVLVGRVHKFYETQNFPDRINKDKIIENRYSEINNYEKYLYNSGTRVVKIFLNVSKKEQAKRFISRIDTPRKNWKISENDIKEREYWDDYQEAFEIMINKTSTKNCPWYVVPADHKWYARLIVSQIVLQTLQEVNPQFPRISDAELHHVEAYRQSLVDSITKPTYSYDERNKRYKEEQEKIKEQTKDMTPKEKKDYMKHLMADGVVGSFAEEDDDTAFEKSEEISIDIIENGNE